MSDLPETPPSSPASHEIGPGYILEATILNVDSQNHLAEVAMDNAEGAIPDVRVVSLYCHPFGGEGIFFLPEAGASCYLFIPSDDGRPFVLGYVMPPTTAPGDSGGRMPMNPGDYALVTRDDNGVIIRRGGVVQVTSTGLSQRLYLPLGNFIRDIAGQYELLSPLGEVGLTHDEPGIGLTKVKYRFKLRENAESPTHMLTVEVGTSTDLMPLTDAGPPAPSYLRILASDSLTGKIEQFSFRLDRSGNVSFKNVGYFRKDVTGDHVTSVKGKLEFLSSAYSLTFSVLGEGKMNLASWEVEALRRIIQKAPEVVMEARNLRLGSGEAIQPAVRGSDLFVWLATHAHLPHGGPPVSPPPQGALSRKVFVD